MSKREQNAFQRLKSKILRPKDRFERVENGLLVGMPDINYCFSGIEGWIELKCPIEPVKPNTALFASNHPISLEQRNWFLKQDNAGGRGFLCIITDSRALLIAGLRASVADINELPVADLERVSLWNALVPIRDPLRWVDFRGVLCGK